MLHTFSLSKTVSRTWNIQEERSRGSWLDDIRRQGGESALCIARLHDQLVTYLSRQRSATVSSTARPKKRSYSLPKMGACAHFYPIWFDVSALPGSIMHASTWPLLSSVMRYAYDSLLQLARMTNFVATFGSNIFITFYSGYELASVSPRSR